VVSAPGPEHTVVVLLGDTELGRQVKNLPMIPVKPEGYLLHAAKVEGKPLIVLQGHDRLGLLWAIASFMQLIHWRDGQPMARAATVTDYPVMHKRGLILSGSDFFHPRRDRKGKIVSTPDTDRLLRQNRLLILVGKFNEPCYQDLIYADCYSRNWKQPDKMPPEAHIEEDLAAMGKNLTPLGITWAAGASSPEELSRKVSGDDESVKGLLHFGRLVEKAGGHLSILLDDIRFPLSPYDVKTHGTAREADTWFITRVMAGLKKEFPKARLLVCPPFCWGPVGRNPYGESRDDYLKTIGDRWPFEVEVFWTGGHVNNETLETQEHIAWWSGLTKRKPYFWQNSAAYWTRLYRRHYPTDELNSLWKNYWEGLPEALGWYGFNGDDIARYGITAAISGGFPSGTFLCPAACAMRQ